MGLPNQTMATLPARMFDTPPDPETGCLPYVQGYQECRQAYFLKQQNEILQQQQVNSNQQQENTELKAQIEAMRQEIKTLKSQQIVQQQPAQTNSNLLATNIAGVTLPTLLIVAVIVLGAAILIWKKFQK